MAPYQVITFLLHAHGMPESRLTEATHFILSLLQEGKADWYYQSTWQSGGADIIPAMVAVSGPSPESRAARHTLLLDFFTRAFDGDTARAQVTLANLLQHLALN